MLGFFGRAIFGISISKNYIYCCNSSENDKEDLDLDYDDWWFSSRKLVFDVILVWFKLVTTVNATKV